MEHLTELHRKNLLLAGSQVLAQSMLMDGEYLLGLKSGGLISFAGADMFSTGWIHLYDARVFFGATGNKQRPASGMDVPLENIAWVKDESADESDEEGLTE